MRFDDRSTDAPVGDILSKVPHVTLAFWAIKILATTLGETGGDALSMTLELGYAMSTLIFLAFFAVTLVPQVASRRYHAFRYWAVVVATTTVGTTMSDYLDRTLELGYVASSLILCLAGSWPPCSSGAAPRGGSSSTTSPRGRTRSSTG